jgi:hypothetical protein
MPAISSCDLKEVGDQRALRLRCLGQLICKEEIRLLITLGWQSITAMLVDYAVITI